MPKKGQTKAVVRAADVDVSIVQANTSITSGLVRIAKMLSGPLTPPQMAKVVYDLRAWKVNIEALIDTVRAPIIKHLKEHGTRDGDTTRLVDGNLSMHAKATGTDPKKLEYLLRSRGLDPAAWMRPHITYKVDYDKLKRLVDTKKLTQAEIDTCDYDENWVVETPYMGRMEENR